MPTLTREALYELVWTTPLKALATRFHVTSVELAKACDRLAIPRPTQGHWARLLHKHDIKRPALAPLAAGVAESIEFKDEPSPVPPPPTIVVSKTLKAAHPAIEQLAKLLGSGGERGTVKTIAHRHQATFRATPEAQDRGLRILDALCKWLAAQGHRVTLQEASDKHRRALVISDSYDSFRISMLEKQIQTIQTAHVPTAKEKADHAQYSWMKPPKFDHKPSGLFTVEFLGLNYGPSYGRWTDSKTTLETKLGDIAAHAADVFARLAAAREVRAKELEVARAAERQRELDLERARHQEVLATDLKKMVAQWDESKKIRAFLDAAETAMAHLGGSPDARDAWLAWARTYADAIDPTKNAARIAKVLTPAAPSPHQWPRP